MQLFDFQVEGALWLSKRKRAYLADVMGLGKTVQAIRAAEAGGYKRVLVIAPASMVGTWELEVLAWSDWKRTFRTVSYDKFARDHRSIEWLKYDPDLIICDEGHYLKGLETKRTKAVLGHWAQKVDAFWMLSGTPTPNGPHELWTALKYLKPSLLKNAGIRGYHDWLNRFCVWSMGERGPRVHKGKNYPELRGLLFGSGFMLRRTFDEVELQLPDLDLRKMPLKGALTPELIMLLDLMESEGFLDYSELPPDSPNTSTARRLLGEHKAKLVVPILQSELLNDDEHSVVLFGYHTNVLDTLEEGLKQFGVARIDGATAKKKRTALVSGFQRGENRVFLSQITAGGVGITLTRSKDVMIVEPSWVPGENAQAIARVRRIGQKANKVSARVATFAGTLDDAINGVVFQKEQTLYKTLDQKGDFE